MQASGPLLWSTFSLFGAYGAGLLAVTGRAFGASDEDQVKRTVGTGLVIGLLGGLLIGAIGLAACEPLVATYRPVRHVGARGSSNGASIHGDRIDFGAHTDLGRRRNGQPAGTRGHAKSL